MPDIRFNDPDWNKSVALSHEQQRILGSNQGISDADLKAAMYGVRAAQAEIAAERRAVAAPLEDLEALRDKAVADFVDGPMRYKAFRELAEQGAAFVPGVTHEDVAPNAEMLEALSDESRRVFTAGPGISVSPSITTGKVETVKGVDHPAHYNKHPSGVECIDVVKHMNFNTGNAMKYLWRSDHKNGLQDLKKALWYIQCEIEMREGKEEVPSEIGHVHPSTHLFLGGNPHDPANWAGHNRPVELNGEG